MSRPFEGIRIIDITHVLAGPFAAYQLGLMGADVIKVEDPNDPDQSRDSGSDKALNHAGMGTGFLTQGSNKRAITLNLKTEQGREIFHFQNRYLTKDGSFRWLEWTSRPDATAKELVAVGRDVTERKRLEDVEREHKRLLERAVQERTQELQQRNAELEEARRETLRRLAQAAEYRDDDTRQPTTRRA